MDDFFNDAKIAGPIIGRNDTSLIVRSARLYEVRCGADVFWVAAQTKDQGRKLLHKRGGDLNLQEYTIKRHYISHCEMIYAEVSNYEKALNQNKFVEFNDLTEYIDCDE